MTSLSSSLWPTGRYSIRFFKLLLGVWLPVCLTISMDQLKLLIFIYTESRKGPQSVVNQPTFERTMANRDQLWAELVDISPQLQPGPHGEASRVLDRLRSRMATFVYCFPPDNPDKLNPSELNPSEYLHVFQMCMKRFGGIRQESLIPGLFAKLAARVLNNSLLDGSAGFLAELIPCITEEDPPVSAEIHEEESVKQVAV